MFSKGIALIIGDKNSDRVILRDLFVDKFVIIEMTANNWDALGVLDRLADSIAAVLLIIEDQGSRCIELLKKMYHSGVNATVPVIAFVNEENTQRDLEICTYGIAELMYFSRGTRSNKQMISKINNFTELYAKQRQLRQQLHKQNKLLKTQQVRLQALNNLVIDALSTIVEFRNFTSLEHTFRIRMLTRQLLLEIRGDYPLTDKQIDTVAYVSSVHDIGKITIPDNILFKPDTLTPDEFEIIKTHSARGYEMLTRLFLLDNDLPENAFDGEVLGFCYDICRFHHEKWDGGGYPYGLDGEKIPIWAQVISLADIYDALISERVYKPAYSQDQALEMILEGECGMINPRLLQAIVSLQNQGRLDLEVIDDY